MEPAASQRGNSLPKVGRPKMLDHVAESTAQGDVHKARVRRAQRQAQRNYRAKKERSLNSANEKSARLESCLRDMLRSYKSLHANLVQSSSDVPADIALQLSKTALDIGRFSRYGIAQADDASRSTPTRHLSPNGGPNRTGSVLAERLINVGMQRTVDMLAAGAAEPLCLNSGLLTRTNMRADQLILAQTLVQVSETSSSLLDHVEFNEAVERLLPPLYRQLEGNSDFSQRVPRLPLPHLQRLEYGRTRTAVVTHEIPEFIGEWLEPMDVEEYLGERGIIIANDEEGTLLKLCVNSPPGSSPNASMSEDAGTQLAPSPSPMTGGHQPVDLSMYLVDDSFLAEPDASPINLLRPDMPQDYHHIERSVTSSEGHSTMGNLGKDVTINVDRLVEELVSRTVCLGLCTGIRRWAVDEAIQLSVALTDGVS